MSTLKPLGRTLIIASSLLLVGSAAQAADAIHAGEWTADISKQEPIPIGGPDHVVVAQVWKGKTKASPKDYMPGEAQVLLSETVDVTQGNGTQNGQYSAVDSKGSLTTAYTGKITTTMVDGQPRTTGEGTWRHVAGSGAYANLRESGTHTWTMTSPTTVSGKWVSTQQSATR